MTQTQEVRNSIYRLSELDWDFSGDKSDSPFSDLHFHPGRFVPQIPAALIGSLTVPGECVLDPFCGAGTTLVETLRLGRKAIGIDLNPVSCLVTRAKTLAISAKDVETVLLRSLHCLAEYRLEHKELSTVARCPRGVQLHKWYHAETGEELCRIWAYIQNERDAAVQDLLLFCFSASLMACCAEKRSWGYVCDNVKPLERCYVDADSVFRDKVTSVIEAYRRRDMRRTPRAELPVQTPSVVLEGDARARLVELDENSIDLVVTSPPYFGVVDYIKAQRLTFEWFGLSIEPLRSIETGARSKRHRHTAFGQYIEELGTVVKELHRVLKRGRILALVVGESAKREPVRDRLMDLLREYGFESDLTVERQIGLRRRQPASLVSELLIVATKI